MSAADVTRADEDSTAAEPAPQPLLRRSRLKAAGLLLACAVVAGQTAAIIVQQQQIRALQQSSRELGPVGPAGSPGPAGPPGPQGVAGRPGRDGTTVVQQTPVDDGLTNGRTVSMTATQARAYCTELATKAWPDSDDPDRTVDALTDTYTATMRDKAFTQCMSDEGFPLPG